MQKVDNTNDMEFLGGHWIADFILMIQNLFHVLSIKFGCVKISNHLKILGLQWQNIIMQQNYRAIFVVI